MKSRYCYNTMTFARIGRRTTIAERFRRWAINREARRNAPDIMPVTWYYTPLSSRK